MLNMKKVFAALILVLTLLGAGSAGWATQVAAPNFFPAIAGFATAAQVEGSSSDAAMMFDIDTDPDGNGIAFAADAATGTAGTVSAASAFAKSAGLFPDFAVTFAFTEAGPGEASDALAEAKAGAVIRSAGAISGGRFDIDIDPFIVNDGDARGSMSFTLRFKEDILFSAGATLDHGLLTTSGAFSDTDFDLIRTGSRVTANLINTRFSVPFTITAPEVGMDLPFELDQVFRVHSENGGLAEVSSIPEPSTTVLLGAGLSWMIAFALIRGRKNRGRIRRYLSERR
ncbi:MAG: PEP-CTERM sorting domain-containing protein [Nitrospirales bacterium]|nr:PEP-CTERM sorting domain-containing protein [Nitrospirales bacterium]